MSTDLDDQSKEIIYKLLRAIESHCEPPSKFCDSWAFVSDDEDNPPPDFPNDDEYTLDKITEWGAESLYYYNYYRLWKYVKKDISSFIYTGNCGDQGFCNYTKVDQETLKNVMAFFNQDQSRWVCTHLNDRLSLTYNKPN